MKRLIITIAALLAAFSASAFTQKPDSLATDFPDLYLDTVKIEVPEINDYNMIGVQYGVSFSRMTMNSTARQDWLFVPESYGVYFTHYSKMFDYLPYFGYRFGLEYGHSGILMHKDEETGRIPLFDDATKVDMRVVDVPFMAHLHYDMNFFKIMADVGIYGGYRLTIEREGIMGEEYERAFKDYEHRFDYGLRGGAGFGFVFDPVEFHFNVGVRYSWSEFQNPDYYSTYYYRFAYPLDIIVSAGITIQLTKRNGRTTSQIRKSAREYVYGAPENNEQRSQNRP